MYDKNQKNKNTIKIIIAVAVIIITAFSVQTTSRNAAIEKTFVAGDTDRVPVFRMSDGGKMEPAGEIARGSQVTLTGKSADGGDMAREVDGSMKKQGKLVEIEADTVHIAEQAKAETEADVVDERTEAC